MDDGPLSMVYYPILSERMDTDPPQTFSVKNEMGSFSSFNASEYNNGT